MEASFGKDFLLYGLLLLAGSRVVAGATCPQQNQEVSSNAKSVNNRVQKLSNDGEFQVKDDNNEYLYKINLCKSTSNVAVSQEDLKDKKLHNAYTIGTFDNVNVVGGSNWLLLTYFGEKYNSHCGGSKKRSIFFIECDQSADTHDERTPKVITEYAPKSGNESFCYYLFEMKHSAACPPTHTKISPGSVFIIIIVVVAVLYLVLGLLYQRFIVGAKGLEQIPNYLLWREFGTLQADGCNYMCRCKTSREATRYKPMDDAIADDDDTDGEKDDALLPM